MSNNIFSILHISDLHKDESCNYNQLLDSLKADKDKFPSLGIAPVKYIVVSGDLVHGSNKDDAKEACEEISQQYAEVAVFLQGLVSTFLDGEIRRLVIVPGNHDMNRAISKYAMKPVDATQVDRVKQSYWESLGRKQIYRFDWKTLSFFEINDEVAYSQRFDSFESFYNAFYNSIGRKFPTKPENEAYTLEFPEDNIAFACFNSCYQLDHLNVMGAIDNDSIHSIYNSLCDYYSKGYLVIGVWHHHLYGPPYRDDFMNKDFTEHLSQNHILVGLYGHQHKSEVVEALSDLSDDMDLDKVMLVSAGTLFGSRKEMLPGVKRQYNVINVEVINGKAHLDVFFREDKKNDSAYPIWGGKHIPDDKKCIGFDVQLNHLSDDELIHIIDDGTRKSNNFKQGIVRLQALNLEKGKGTIDGYLQKLNIADDAEFLVENIQNPQTEIAYAYLLQALMRLGRKDEIKKRLDTGLFKDSKSPLIKETIAQANKIIAKKPWELHQ